MKALLQTLTTSSGVILKFELNLKKTARDKRTPSFVSSRMTVLEEYWNHYRSTYLKFIDMPDASMTQYELDDTFSEVQDCYLDAKALLLSWLPTSTQARPTEQTTPAPNVTPLTGKLPKLEIPRFSGEPREWESFRDLFKAMVHDLPNLSGAVKLQYLKLSLTDEAAQLVRNIAVSDANYQDAWQLLVDRYDNPRVLVQTHVRALLSIAATGKESPTGLKRLLDATNESVRALKNLNQPVQHWDAILVDLTCQRLDQLSRRDWETSLGDSREFPTYKQLSAFLETRVRALEAARPVATSSNQPIQPSTASAKVSKQGLSSHTASTNSDDAKKKTGRKCGLCPQIHYIGSCPKYKAMELAQREEQVRRLRLCRNCLGYSLLAAACPSTRTCATCSQNHHTSLHTQARSSTAVSASASPPAANTSTSTEPPANPVQANHATSTRQISRNVLLGTALISLISVSGRSVPARVLIDPGSEGSFTTEAKAQALRATRTSAIIPVSGIAGTRAGVSNSIVSLKVCSRIDPSVRISVVACVLPRVTGDLPSRVVPKRQWDHIVDLNLADPDFDKPGKIDLILGAEVYREILLSGVRLGPPGSPLAQETVFGWILTGPVSQNVSPSHSLERNVLVHHCRVENDLSELVRKFWEVEELPARSHLTKEDEDCENLFKTSHRRDNTGRYVVRLPFRKDPDESLGESRAFACRALTRVERRHEADPAIQSEYSRFLSEYLSLKHMEPSTSTSDGPRAYYLPHHAVVREVNGSSKLRVVFNASHQTSSGVSLNDILLPGPKLQTDIATILMRWSRHRVVFAADIVKMFRQILVAPEDCDYQRIVYRESPAAPVQDMRLLTVTYGTACAPYLAIRTLQQLADEEAHRYPEAAHVVRQDTYVDDTLTGADDLQTARELKDSLTALMRSGGFELSKWMSSSRELLHDANNETPSTSSRSFDSSEWVRTLGVVWMPSDDSFRVKLHLINNDTTATKRWLLSELARTFDPLGWIAPVMAYTEMILSRPRSSIHGFNFEHHFHVWKNSPYRVGLVRHLNRVDASERAYAAAVYIRVEADDDSVTVSLLCAKSKVAPVRSVSLPRLELCGAVLLARLLIYVAEALEDDISKEIFAWSDSTVTLAWIRGHPSRWVTFVANRVAEIHTLLPSTNWQHVKSSDNPADLATRGIPPNQILDSKLWWHGPDWLAKPSSEWPQSSLAYAASTDLEARVEQKVHATLLEDKNENAVLARFSSLQRLLRITAWCLRFRKRHDSSQHDSIRPLSATEIANARHRWMLLTQSQAFHEEITALRKKQPVSSSSSLRRLNPFLDEQGVLRIGGRLQHASLAYDERHAAILPASAKFTELLIRQAHEVTLHGGPLLTMSYLLRFCWIIGGRNKVRTMVHRCVECTRHRDATPQQQMGQLPSTRVTRPSRPFEKAGLDYAGPFLLRASSGRGRTTFKVYIAVFICLATRATHLEVVGSYSSASFIGAYKRFTARRGICAELHSDNGTNFRGADRELRAIFLAASSVSREVAAALANDGTAWHFIPPSAPHFGGIWEAGVKSTKYHLRRVIGETVMTFEEFSTVVTQIEGCLNSRPICPLSSDPLDLVALTPGHFLIGGAPTAPPEPSTLHLPTARMERWQLTSHMVESFWRRWQSEYLNYLQQRNKWKTKKPNIEVGELVLVRDNLLPPAKWPLARVTETHPGPDGLTRVVTVKTATTTLRRPIVKLVLLLVTDSTT